MAKKPTKPRKPTKAAVKAAADRAESRAKGEEVKPATDPVMNPPEVKAKRGRPTKYDPAMCETVIELGEQGKSKAQICADLRIKFDTYKEWQKQHPEFLEAVKEAELLAQAWWENKGQAGLDAGPGMFNATAYIFQMKNRFRHDYSDKFEVKHDGTAAFLACLKKMNGASA